MNNEDIKIPIRMRKRPRFAGMPIPYTTWIDDKGIPDFKINDERLRRKVIAQRRCAMCGERMNAQIVFIGGPGSVEQGQLFVDAGMHPACARYAWDVCPYIVYGKGHAKLHRDVWADFERGQMVFELQEIPTDKPDRMGMLTTDGYTVVDPNGRFVVRANKATGPVEWKVYR